MAGRDIRLCFGRYRLLAGRHVDPRIRQFGQPLPVPGHWQRYYQTEEYGEREQDADGREDQAEWDRTKDQILRHYQRPGKGKKKDRGGDTRRHWPDADQPPDEAGTDRGQDRYPRSGSGDGQYHAGEAHYRDPADM